jgi:integrase
VLWRVPVFQFTFLTGLRRSEVARLRWRDVEHVCSPGRACLVLREQKSRREERLSLSRKAARLLTRIPRGASGEYVFVSPVMGDATDRRERGWGEATSRAFAKYRKAAGVRSGLTFHSLRAGYITTLARSGLNAVAIKRLARHKEIKTSLRYIEATGEAFRGNLDEAFGSFD